MTESAGPAGVSRGVGASKANITGAAAWPRLSKNKLPKKAYESRIVKEQ